MTRTDEEIEQICLRLINNQIGERALDVSPDEFQRFYSTFVNTTRQIPLVSLVNLEDIVVAQFSTISPQHFDITSKGDLKEDSFGFIPQKRWYGTKEKPEKFITFLRREIAENYAKLIVVGCLGFGILFFVDSTNLYDLMISLLIQSSTVFLSLYIIFTVSQTQNLFRDLLLFKKGILQHYYNDDRNVTLLGILTVALTFFSAGVIYLLTSYGPAVPISWFPLLGRILKAATTTIVLVLLFDTFLTVANYYLERNRDVLERDIVGQILNQDYEEFTRSARKVI